MGQKVNPIGFRLGVYRQWDARWYADKEYTKLLHEDLAMRRLIGSRLRNAGVARIETERSANQLTVIIQTAKPGIVIGKQGASVDALRDELERISGKKVRVTIHEIKTPELDARLVAENVASQLEKRIAFRRALKQTVMRSMRAGAKGVKLEVSGRLGGAEMSRREWDRDGRVPLHTLRANIDFGRAEARTTFGRIGVTCWIYKGDYVTATGEPVMTGGPGREVVELARPLAAPERERRPMAAPAAPDREEVAPAALAEAAAEAEAVPRSAWSTARRRGRGGGGARRGRGRGRCRRRRGGDRGARRGGPRARRRARGRRQGGEAPRQEAGGAPPAGSGQEAGPGRRARDRG